MASKLKLLVLISSILAFWGAYRFAQVFTPPPLPKLDEDAYWGPGAPKPDDPAIKPFKIHVSDEVLKDLNNRLDRTRDLAAPLEGISFEYGFNTNTLKKVLTFWRKEYKWREREAFLNSFPQFKTQIQGLDIHFIHIKPDLVKTGAKRTVPILILHGWPGSVREFSSLLPLLTQKPAAGSDFVFEAIVPSLAGYGWSQAAAKPGLGTAEMAVIFKNLMKRLGHNRFYVHGGDWGALIGSTIATIFPDNLFGFHSTMCQTTSNSYFKLFLGSFFPSLVVSPEHQDKIYPLGKTFSFLLEEMGYLHLQSTKPDTVGVGLTDSPAGLAAYILEKFSTWTNKDWRSVPDGGLTKKYTYTDLLDNVMIYWVTNSITSSMRLYSEAMNYRTLGMQLDKIPTKVQTACIKFANELLYMPDSLLRDKYHRLIQITDVDDGGHFAAFEVPKVVAEDLWKAVVIMEEHKDGEKKKFGSSK